MWIRSWLQLPLPLSTYFCKGVKHSLQAEGLILQGKLQPLEKGRDMVALWATPLHAPAPQCYARSPSLDLASMPVTLSLSPGVEIIG